MIPKEAIEAACAALNKRDRGNAISIPDVVAMLTAAFAATPAPDPQAENERLRAALEKVAGADFLDFSLAPERSAVPIARAALERT